MWTLLLSMISVTIFKLKSTPFMTKYWAPINLKKMHYLSSDWRAQIKFTTNIMEYITMIKRTLNVLNSYSN